MKKIIFKGCGTAIATPFTEDGINFKEFEKLIEYQKKCLFVTHSSKEMEMMCDNKLAKVLTLS